MLDAVILAGGRGTRLSEVLPNTQKVLAPVLGRPFLTHVLDQLEYYRYKRAVLCCGYKSEQIRDIIGSQYGDLEVLYSFEEVPLGTGGAIRNALPLIETSEFLAMNGDCFLDVRLDIFNHWHEGRWVRTPSIASVYADDASRFGILEFQSDGHTVKSFLEKTVGSSGWINAGSYILPKNLVEEVEPNKAISLEYDVFPKWVGNVGIQAFKSTGKFIDIGIPESLSEADQFFEAIIRRREDLKKPILSC